jgi:hypothetical protein
MENIKHYFFIAKPRKINFFNSSFETRMDPSVYSSSDIYDFFDKKKSHFSTLLPYRFFYNLNRSFDCFLLSMYYDLLLTYYVCYFNLGSTMKSRVDFPFYKFNR